MTKINQSKVGEPVGASTTTPLVAKTFPAYVKPNIRETHKLLTPELIAELDKTLCFDFADLHKILSTVRHSKSPHMPEFYKWIETRILGILGTQTKQTQFIKDTYGNMFAIIGDKADYVTMFTSHLDTVHGIKWRDIPSQEVFIDIKDDILRVEGIVLGQCLGADDGTGIAISFELMKKEVAGVYAFFLDEEIGGLGSSFASTSPEFETTIEGIKHVVSFDRAGCADIITHQGGVRTASDEFAKALATQMAELDIDLQYSASTGGSFTDSKSFYTKIKECTNIAVGYQSQHTVNESQSVKHLDKLIAALVQVDWKSLPAERDETKKEDLYSAWGFGYGGYDDYDYSGYYSGKSKGGKNRVKSYDYREGYKEGYSDGYFAAFDEMEDEGLVGKPAANVKPFGDIDTAFFNKHNVYPQEFTLEEFSLWVHSKPYASLTKDLKDVLDVLYDAFKIGVKRSNELTTFK